MFLISIKVEFSRGLQGTDAIKETNTYLLPCANQCGSLKSYFICLSLEGLNRMNSELVDSHKTWEDFINNYNSSFQFVLTIMYTSVNGQSAKGHTPKKGASSLLLDPSLLLS